MDAKIATIFLFPKIILLSLIKIAIQYLKIAVRHPKISGLKIAVHSLKIAGLKIIARVCVRVYACAPHFAEVSKIAQDAPERPPPERPPPNTGTHDNRKKGGTPAKQNLLVVEDLHGNNEKS